MKHFNNLLNSFSLHKLIIILVILTSIAGTLFGFIIGIYTQEQRIFNILNEVSDYSYNYINYDKQIFEISKVNGTCTLNDENTYSCQMINQHSNVSRFIVIK